MYCFQNDQSDLQGECADPLLARLRAKLPRPLVFCSGVFDVLHAGHVNFLEQARRHGRSLVVGIHGDASARRRSGGVGGLLNSAVNRARVVGSMASVTTVVLFDDDRPLALLRSLAPEFHVAATADPAAVAVMAGWGGQSVIVPRTPGLSSSAMLARLLRGHDKTMAA